MADQEAQKYVIDMFEKITKATSIDDIKSIIDTCTEAKNRMSDNVYPELKFSITPEEISQLIVSGILDEDHNFTKELNATLANPLTKLLYATAWKNGDLPKIKHIISGVLACDSESNDQEKAVVFHHFGRHLTKKQGQPIIDQHVIRAFGIFNPDDKSKVWKIQEMRKLNTVDKSTAHLFQRIKNGSFPIRCRWS